MYNNFISGSNTYIDCVLGWIYWIVTFSQAGAPRPAQLSASPAARVSAFCVGCIWLTLRFYIQHCGQVTNLTSITCILYCWYTSNRGVLNSTLIANLHGFSKVFWLQLINIHSEYKFQIHQASLYGIDFCAMAPLKRIGLLSPPSVRTNRSLICSQVELLCFCTSAFNLCAIWGKWANTGKMETCFFFFLNYYYLAVILPYCWLSHSFAHLSIHYHHCNYFDNDSKRGWHVLCIFFIGLW